MKSLVKGTGVGIGIVVGCMIAFNVINTIDEICMKFKKEEK